MRVYGPVPSRRFGLSLGIDLIPRKACPFDCIYCQVGPTDRLLTTPEDFFPMDEILSEVQEALQGNNKPNVITLAGSGEPTLYRPMGELIDELHQVVDIPILLITNGSLLWMDSVAKAANKADILAPSLDAGDGETFDRINRPHPEITYEKLLNGLERVTHSHPGEVHLEVMLVQGINEDPENLIAIKNQLNKLHFDRIDVNTPVRPPIPERGAIPCNESALNRALEILGPKAHAIGTFKQPNEASQTVSHSFSDRDKDIREILLRRPCTINDIAASLGLRHTEVTQSLGRLKTAGLIQSRRGNRETYFHITTPNPTILRSSE